MSIPASVFPEWAEPMPEIGRGVYRLTTGPRDHRHAYHKHCPWSPDGSEVLLLRHNRTHPTGEVCLLDLSDGQMEVVGETTFWTDHEAAQQQWTGRRPCVLFRIEKKGEDILVRVDTETGERREYPGNITPDHTSPAGRYVFGRTPLAEMFPEDRIAPRHDKGLARLDLDTGRKAVIVSLERLVEMHPDTETVRPCHNYVKQTIVQPRTGRLLFVFGNDSFWRAMEEPMVKMLCTVDPDGSDLRMLGSIGDHPMWHPIENVVLFNTHVADVGKRIALVPDDEGEERGYLDDWRGGGHPSLSPDARYLLTDAYNREENEASIRLIDREAGTEYRPAVMNNPGNVKAHARALEADYGGKGIVASLRNGIRNVRMGVFNTHCHPSWSREGRFVLFNSDHDGVSQLYLLDRREALCD
mgnify:CR=1 FL=1